MNINPVPTWKVAPFCRLLVPLIIGILLEWYTGFSFAFILFCFGCFLIALLLIYFLPVEVRYKAREFQGVLLHLVLICFAMGLVWVNDTRHHPDWFGKVYHDNSSLIVRIDEPLVERVKSFKANGYVETVINEGKAIPVKGIIVIYFSKDSLVPSLCYGDKILIQKPLQKIRNSGNPGAFDYERYSAFHQTFHNVYLGQHEWILLPAKAVNPFYAFIFSTRNYIVDVLQTHISGTRREKGIAEALLIGYKEDLDKDLVQAYSNAGVVHIIAISGLHLGLIYVMLSWILNRLPFIKKVVFLKVSLLLSCLWMFSILSGAAASVLRSAVMFTFILIGKSYFKQAVIYNSLAVSAFVLLCFNPYFLWDVGFQLSYFALIGIVSLQQPLYRLWYLKSKWMSKIWEMLSVTIAAQVFTFPICIYYFHQFPNLFAITNLVAVPLSTVILFAEIFLVLVSGIAVAALYTGKVTGGLIWGMNYFISHIDDLSFSVWDNIYANLYTTMVLYLFVTALCAWLLYKSKKGMQFALLSLAVFAGLHAYAKFRLTKQARIIIYNIPGHQAMDFIYQNGYCFAGDSILRDDAVLQNFHLKPARIFLQLEKATAKPGNLIQHNNFWQFFDKRLLLIDTAVQYDPAEEKLLVDVLVISKNPSLKISGLITAVRPAAIVFDSSNSLWKIAGWKKECERLALPCFSIPEQGAFVLNID